MSEKIGSDEAVTDPMPDFEGDHPSLFDGTDLRRHPRTGRPTVGGITPVRSFRLPVQLGAELDARAAADGVPATEITRRALVQYLRR